MLLTIHNLPVTTRYADIKSLLQSKCGLQHVILDNLVPEGVGKKVTVGVAEDADAAILVRKINGLYWNEQQLYVKDVRQQKTASEQPFRSSNSQLEESSDQNYMSMNLQQHSSYNKNMGMPMMTPVQPMMSAMYCMPDYNNQEYMQSVGNMQSGSYMQSQSYDQAPQKVQSAYMGISGYSQTASQMTQVGMVAQFNKNQDFAASSQFESQNLDWEEAYKEKDFDPKRPMFGQRSPNNEANWFPDQQRRESPDRSRDNRDQAWAPRGPDNRRPDDYRPSFRPDDRSGFKKPRPDFRPTDRPAILQNPRPDFRPTDRPALLQNPRPNFGSNEGRQNQFSGRPNERQGRSNEREAFFERSNEFPRRSNERPGEFSGRPNEFSGRTNERPSQFSGRPNQVSGKMNMRPSEFSGRPNEFSGRPNNRQGRSEDNGRPNRYQGRQYEHEERPNEIFERKGRQNDRQGFSRNDRAVVTRSNVRSELQPNDRSEIPRRAPRSRPDFPDSRKRKYDDRSENRDIERPERVSRPKIASKRPANPPKDQQFGQQGAFKLMTDAAKVKLSKRMFIGGMRKTAYEIYLNLAIKDLDYIHKQHIRTLVKQRLEKLLGARTLVPPLECFEIYRAVYPASEDKATYNTVLSRIAQLKAKEALGIVPGATVTAGPGVKPATLPKSLPSKITKGEREAIKKMKEAKSLLSQGKVPRFPEGDKKKVAQQKREEKEGHIPEVGAAYKTAIEEEADKITDLFIHELNNAPNKRQQLAYNTVDRTELVAEIKKNLIQTLSRRISDSGLKVVRIYGNPTLPKRELLEKLLLRFGVQSLRKSTKAMLYTAAVDTYANYDKLCALELTVPGGITVSFKPFHLAPRQKADMKLLKTMRKKIIQDMIDKSDLNLLDKDWPTKETEIKEKEAALKAARAEKRAEAKKLADAEKQVEDEKQEDANDTVVEKEAVDEKQEDAKDTIVEKEAVAEKLADAKDTVVEKEAVAEKLADAKKNTAVEKQAVVQKQAVVGKQEDANKQAVAENEAITVEKVQEKTEEQEVLKTVKKEALETVKDEAFEAEQEGGLPDVDLTEDDDLADLESSKNDSNDYLNDDFHVIDEVHESDSDDCTGINSEDMDDGIEENCDDETNDVVNGVYYKNDDFCNDVLDDDQDEADDCDIDIDNIDVNIDDVNEDDLEDY